MKIGVVQSFSEKGAISKNIETHLKLIYLAIQQKANAIVFPELYDEVIQVYPSGDNHIIVEFVSTGTAPDDSKFELPICTIFTFENGKITKDFTYYDNFEEGEEQ